MKRALALLTLFVSAVVFAEWYPVAVPGVPNDATIISTANGRVVIATNDGVFEVRDGGIVREMIRGADVVWGTVDGGCITAYTRNAYRHVCSDAGTLIDNGTNSLDSIGRVHPIGNVRYLAGRARPTSQGMWIDDGVGFPAQMLVGGSQPFWLGGSAVPHVATYLSGGGHHFVAGGLQLRQLVRGVDGGFDNRGEPVDGGVVVNALDVYLEGLGHRVIVATTSDGGEGAIAHVPLPLTGSYAERVNTPTGISSVVGVTFDPTTNPNNTFSDGFGMACGRSSAGDVVLQPIPDPASAARTWVANTSQSSLTGPFSRVTCLDGRTCVLLTTRDAGENVYIYDNRSGPTVTIQGPPSFSSGQPAVITLSAVDPDGDPFIFDAGLAALSDAGTARLLDGGVIEFTAGPVCGAPLNLLVSFGASDGVHNAAQTFVVSVAAGNPDPPTLSTTTLQIQAGTDAGRVDVTRAAGGICPATAVVWTLLDGGSLFSSVTPDGDSRVFTPPTHYCSPTPGEAVYSVVSTNGQGTSSSQTVTAQLLPWGPPEKPFANDLNVAIDAGDTVVLARDAGHFCVAATALVETHWDLPAVDGGFRASVGAQVFPMTSPLPLEGDTLTLTTAPCVSATFDIPVRSEIAGQTSATPNPVVHVTVTPNLSVSNVSFSSLSGAELDGGLLVTATADFVCAGAIGLSANVSVSRDGEPVGDAGLRFTPTSGSAFFPLPDCAGGTFDIVAYLVGSDGGQTNISTTATATVAPGVVPPPSVAVTDTAVSCDTGGSATLSIVAKPRCTGLSYTWRPVSGIAVDVPDAGDSVVLRTVSTELSEILGQTIGLQVTPVSGDRSFPSTLQEVSFEKQPFVDVKHQTDAPIAADTELFGITVTLTNTESCEVKNVDYVETLTETRVVPASIRVNGQPVDAERIVIGSRTLAITGLTLPPGEPVQIYYSARPVLFGTPKPTGKAVLRFGQATEYDISDSSGFAREPGSNPPGCGCNASAGGGVALLALLALCRRKRRQR